MAARFNVPSGKTGYRARYENFKGCDFTSDPLRIDPHRFPEAENLMLDINGYPEKRFGFRKIQWTGSAPNKGNIKDMVRGVIDGIVICLLHSDMHVSAYAVQNGEFLFQCNAPCSGLAQTFAAYSAANKMFCFGLKTDGAPYYYVLKRENGVFSFSGLDSEDVKIPTVTAMRTNKNVDGAAMENVNLLSQKRRITFSLTKEDLKRDAPAGGNYAWTYSYDNSPILHLGMPADKLKLDNWKKIALRYYYTGTGYEDSDVQSKWESVYGSSWRSEQSAWYKRSRDTDNLTWDQAFYEYVTATGNAPEFLPYAVKTRDDGTPYTSEIPVVFVAINAGTPPKNKVYAVCCMISDVFAYPNDVYIFLKTSECSSNYYNGKVSSYISFAPDANVQENVEMTYLVSDAVQNKNLKKVCSASVCAPFGISGAGDRIFLAGFPEEKNVIRFSEMENNLYFPDLNYITAGTDATQVLSLFPVGGYLCAAKEVNGQDVNLYIIEGSMQDGKAAFLVKEGVAGTGISEKNCACLVEDEPHFLSENGVFSLISSDITARKTVVNRSYFADPKIKAEPKEGACLCYFNSLLLLSFPESGHVYVFNTRDKTYFERAGGEHYIYECWFWTGIYATAFFKEKDGLYFGTKTGVIYRFNNDLSGIARYRDAAVDSAGNDTFKAICAYFKTGAFDDGSFMTLKNMQKRGCGVLLKPFTRSSAEISVLCDSGGRKLKDLYADIFDWTYIDFTRVEFSANPAVRILPFNTKVKKYATIQFIVKNETLGESFGVIGIEKAYTFGNYKKN